MVYAAFYTANTSWLQGRMFNASSDANINEVFDRYIALQKYLRKRGIDIRTYDMYDDPRQVDVWLMMDPSRAIFLFLLKNKIKPRRVILFLQEPPTVNPKAWMFFSLYRWLFGAVATWNTTFHKKYARCFHYSFHPVSFNCERYPQYRAKEKKNLTLLMHSNQNPHTISDRELFSLRRRVCLYFDHRGDQLLDLYGSGWNDVRSKHPFFSECYRGIADDKRETYAEHYYVFCIANCDAPGYITYDPFIAMSVGSVPIYYPMTGSDDVIPRDTFVNMRKFDSFDALTRHLQLLIRTGEYVKMQERGWQFLNSSAYQPFTVNQFCQDIHRIITHVVV